MPVNRHVGKQGRLTLKWAWIAAARNAVRRQGPLKDLFDRYTDNGKHDRNRGYIAVAQRMCLIGYVLWKKDVDYQPTPPPRPGSPAWRELQSCEWQTSVERSQESRSPRPSSGKAPLRPATSAVESKTPDPVPGNIFCGEKARLKERASSTQGRRSKSDELSRPGTGQPPRGYGCGENAVSGQSLSERPPPDLRLNGPPAPDAIMLPSPLLARDPHKWIAVTAERSASLGLAQARERDAMKNHRAKKPPLKGVFC